MLWDNIPFDAQTAAILNNAPEWVRRTICCARWELEHAGHPSEETGAADENTNETAATPKSKPRVVLAVVSPASDAQPESANPAPISASPVPLPAPQPNRYESRLSAALVGRWAAKAGLDVVAHGVLEQDDQAWTFQLLVEDAWQGRGLGTLLVRHAAGRAKALGARHLVLVSADSNDTLLRAVGSAGFVARVERHDGAVHVTVPLDAVRAIEPA